MKKHSFVLIILGLVTMGCWALPPTMMSALSAASDTFANQNAYCNNLVASASILSEGGNPASTTYDDWRLPTQEEAELFVGQTADGTYIWTDTVNDTSVGVWIILRLSDGHWYSNSYNTTYYVRCVR